MAESGVIRGIEQEKTMPNIMERLSSATITKLISQISACFIPLYFAESKRRFGYGDGIDNDGKCHAGCIRWLRRRFVL
jgi:hypothetical protein